MTSRILKTVLAATAVAAAATTVQAEISTDFNAQTGTITFTKLTTSPLQASTGSIYCSGACPEVTPDMLDPTESIQGNAIAIPVPPMVFAGQTHVHVLSFWDDLFFPKGTATFTVCANGAKFRKQIDPQRAACAKVSLRSKGAVVAIPVPAPKIKLRQ